MNRRRNHAAFRSKRGTTRRGFFALAGAVAAGQAAVFAGEPSGRRAATAPPAADGPRIGVIGCRYQGSVIAAKAKAHGRVIALADVDQAVRDLSAIDSKVAAQVQLTPAEIYADVATADRHVDYRRLVDDTRVDVILIGTPDHWHTKMLIDAVKAGKDVYCEKPLTLTIDEGKEICKAVRDSGRIVQVGSWQRSDSRFRTAVEMVRAGRIGKLEKVDVVLGKNQVGGPFAKQPLPPGLDWDLWQGQTPDVAYVPERCHFNFRGWQA